MDWQKIKNSPINIDLLVVDDNLAKTLKEVNTPVIFDANSNFHPSGLYSTEIFGEVGSEARMSNFGYIKLNTKILHPFVYYCVVELKGLYDDIMSSKASAVFDPKIKDFVKSTAKEAQSGYTFFLEHLPKIEFKPSGSDKRDFYIKFVTKAIKENKHLMDKLLVIPAGIRDYSVDEVEGQQEDEVNSLYRKVIYHSSLIDPIISKNSPQVYDTTIYSVQKSVYSVFEYFLKMLEGKSKFIQDKWVSRKVFNSTRNVLSNSVENASSATDPMRLGINECFVGIHQFCRILLPAVAFHIKDKYLKDIFIQNEGYAMLTNTKTLKREKVPINSILKEYDSWTTTDGIEKIVALLSDLNIRTKPILLAKGSHTLGLVYRDKNYFKFFTDIDDLPQNYSRDNVRIVTYAEFIYMCIYHLSGKYPGLVTRYPITGYGSIYPVFIKLKTTMSYETLQELDDNWQPSGSIAPCMPVLDSEFFNTVSVHPTHYAALEADVDGDTLSLVAITTDEAIEEINNHLKKKEYYISYDNSFFFSISTEVLDSVLFFMTENN